MPSMVKRISEIQKSTKALRTKLEEVVKNLDDTKAPDREDTVNALMDALISLADAEDDLAVAREHERHMKKRH